MKVFDQTLEKYGADLAAVRSFDDGDTPDLLPYATLLASREPDDPTFTALAGVYEWQNTPLMFLVDADKLTTSQSLNIIRRRVAMRGDAPYLGVIRPGQLTIYRVSLDKATLDNARIKLEIPSGEESATFPYLSNQRPDVATNQRQWISKVILKLLSASIEDLKNRFSVASEDAISLVGRALFTRFLGDRELLPDLLTTGGHREAAKLFDNADHAATTSRWLDDTFNGDFLPLSQNLFESLPAEAFLTLGNILRRAPDGQLYLGWEEKWENLHFAHIPVGVLSQAYEHYLRKHSPDKQHKEGGYYTPRIIADMMVRGAFHALRRDGTAHAARVLDPAAGAGVFLLTAFRELVAERWRHDKVRPDTRVLREILYQQITGFDINESALRFAALGLYLMSIELDSHPEPIQKLRFENLRGIVLHKVGEGQDNLPSRSLGSLGSQVGQEHVGSYDLVIGNPPWASGTGLPGWSQVLGNVARIAQTRIGTDIRPKLPNEVLDLPFVWRAMEWAKPGGQVAFALHARLLFQQGEGMPEARSDLFRALNVTGIINGAELRNTNVWPEVSAPFCLLFARNELPPPGAGFRFVSPRPEDPLNRAGNLRVDANNAEIVASDQITHRPEVLKILFRGSRLDLELYERLRSRRLQTLAEFWKTYFGVHQGKPRFTGNGYQRLRPSSRIREKGDGKPGVSAKYLWDLPELTSEAIQTLLVNGTKFASFYRERIHDPRPRTLFQGPLLIVHEAPPAQSGRIQTAVSDEDVIFNQSYHGYSAREHVQGKLLVRYLALLLGSKPALWYALITSGRFGFEREVIEKFVIDDIPVPSFEDFKPSDLEHIDQSFETVSSKNNEAAWSRIDEWVASLYGLRESDLQVVADTLRFNLPFSKNRIDAQVPPKDPEEVSAFRDALDSELEPWVRRMDMRLSIVNEKLPGISPWRFLRIGTKGNSANRAGNYDWSKILRVADELAATEIVCPDAAERCLWLGRLNQARYWSHSQARLLARHIVWEHVDFLSGLKVQ